VRETESSARCEHLSKHKRASSKPREHTGALHLGQPWNQHRRKVSETENLLVLEISTSAQCNCSSPRIRIADSILLPSCTITRFGITTRCVSAKFSLKIKASSNNRMREYRAQYLKKPKNCRHQIASSPASKIGIVISSKEQDMIVR
jgi:hypothetical protein